MRKIVENGLENLEGYEELRDGEKFIYKNMYEWVAIKVNNDYSVFLNGINKFIVAQKYNNCLSIGSGDVKEFGTYAEAERFATKTKPTL